MCFVVCAVLCVLCVCSVVCAVLCVCNVVCAVLCVTVCCVGHQCKDVTTHITGACVCCVHKGQTVGFLKYNCDELPHTYVFARAPC